jgi:type IV pilus assembly protein PilW
MRQRRVRGMTLIELMVALVLGLILSLAVFGIMTTFDGRRRTLTAGADLDQSGTVAMFLIDRWVRSAGSGLAQASSYAYGCPLFAAKGSTKVLPNTALPAPFGSVSAGTSGKFPLAPVLILPGQTTPNATGQASDVLAVMSASSANGNVPTPFTTFPAAAEITLANTVGFGANDLVLLADQQPAESGTISPCLLTQAASTISGGSATTMALGGTWYSAAVDTVSVAGFNDTGVAINLGNPASSQPPSFQLIGVGSNNTLYSYDLLQTTATPLQARAEGVFEVHALYGVDTDKDGKVNLWVRPDSGSYTVASLTAGTAEAASLLKTIKALRVGLIMRTALPEKEPVNAATTLQLFTDLDDTLKFSRTLSSTEQSYRYRTLEATIPLRNNLL